MQLRKAREISEIVAGVTQVDREIEECSRQVDHHVQKHSRDWKHDTFKGIP